MQNKVRGIRGANVVIENTRDAIFKATRDLLEKMIAENQVKPEDIAAIYFTLTPDLNAAFPAEVAREMGMLTVPLLCMQEIGVPDSLAKVVRILILINSQLKQNEIKHVFLGEAKKLRDDLTQEET